MINTMRLSVFAVLAIGLFGCGDNGGCKDCKNNMEKTPMEKSYDSQKDMESKDMHMCNKCGKPDDGRGPGYCACHKDKMAPPPCKPKDDGRGPGACACKRQEKAMKADEQEMEKCKCKPKCKCKQAENMQQ